MRIAPSIFKIVLTSVIVLVASYTSSAAQRSMGAQQFIFDDNKVPLRTLTIDVTAPMTASYNLHLPATPPSGAMNFLASDATGAMSWQPSALPPLPQNNIWIGNASNQATPYAPTVAGAVFVLSPTLQPSWSTVIPAGTTISFSQITSGVNTGQNLQVGAGSTLQPLAGGTVVSNSLVGAGPGKFSGAVSIPLNASTLAVSFPGISASSSVVVSVLDPNASLGVVTATVQSISAGVGFTVFFAADYPRNSGLLHYTVVNP
jgi:hypothetical protein